jgi:hypothetical protein
MPMRALPVVILAGLILLAAFLVSVATAGRVRPADPGRYRPRGTHRKASTRFDDAPAAPAADETGPAADAPTDFFTGAALDPAAGIVRCDDCRALFHPDTVALLVKHNAGCCASCGGTALRPLAAAAARRAARDAAGPRRDRALVPEPTTPQAYAAALGRLVAVSARVETRLPVRRGAPPSLLVRDAWGNALRLVFVGEAFRGLRGRAFADGLIGSPVRVRGLLLRDEAHGLRLLVSDPAMLRDAAP